MEDLPRILKKREAHKTTDLVKWVRENITHSCMVEVKVAKQLKDTEAVYATQFKPHQIKNLLSEVYTQKLVDTGLRQPADIVHFANTEHYVILCFKNVKVLINAKNYPFDQVKVGTEQAINLGRII